MSVPAQIKWIATATNGPGECGIKEFWYTSDNAPVDADEHQRVADALAAMTQRAEAAEQWQTRVPWSAMRMVLDAAFQFATGNDELWADCEQVETWVDEHQIGDESCETLHPETRKEAQP